MTFTVCSPSPNSRPRRIISCWCSRTRGIRSAKQLSQQVADPAGHLVHVVVQVGHPCEHRTRADPARHAARGVHDVPGQRAPGPAAPDPGNAANTSDARAATWGVRGTRRWTGPRSSTNVSMSDAPSRTVRPRFQQGCLALRSQFRIVPPESRTRGGGGTPSAPPPAAPPGAPRSRSRTCGWPRAGGREGRWAGPDLRPGRSGRVVEACGVRVEGLGTA